MRSIVRFLRLRSFASPNLVVGADFAIALFSLPYRSPVFQPSVCSAVFRLLLYPRGIRSIASELDVYISQSCSPTHCSSLTLERLLSLLRSCYHTRRASECAKYLTRVHGLAHCKGCLFATCVSRQFSNVDSRLRSTSWHSGKDEAIGLTIAPYERRNSWLLRLTRRHWIIFRDCHALSNGKTLQPFLAMSTLYAYFLSLTSLLLASGPVVFACPSLV